MRLAVLLDTKSNHLTLIRLLLSVLVIYSHSFSLGNFGDELILGFGNDKYGNLAVNCFFVVSGLLITRSYMRCKTTKQYFLNRILRIFPGFWIALLVTAFLICPLVFGLKNSQIGLYWKTSHDSPLGYVWKNLFLKMIQTNIGSMFDTNNYPYLVNGAIWTLSYEFVCYIMVAITGFFGLLRSHFTWIFILIVFSILNALIYSGTLAHLPMSTSISALIHFMAYFIAGMVLFLFADRISVKPLYTLFTTTILLVLTLFSCSVTLYIAYHLLMPILLAYTVISLAYISDETKWERNMPDLSYGLYIYGWVVQQSLIYLGVLSNSLIVFFVSATFITSLLALCSFYFIEKPCMNMKKAF